jgi:hypothetical protein
MTQPPIYVVDTHALVWYLEGRLTALGKQALSVLSRPTSRLVVPIHCFEEIRLKFFPKESGAKMIRVPPSAALRVVAHTTNIRIFPRGAGVLAEENRLRKLKLISDQDLPICATAIAIAKATSVDVFVLSKDGQMKRSGLVQLVW